MGLDIGYLQTKIRELQSKNEELAEMVEQSLQREKNIIKVINQKFLEEKKINEELFKEIIGNTIDLIYKEKFEFIFNKYIENISKTTTDLKKVFNKHVDSLLEEIALLKKDNSFVTTLVVTKLKLSKEEFSYFCKKFDKEYPSKRIKEDLNKFIMDLRFKGGNFIKEVLKEE